MNEEIQCPCKESRNREMKIIAEASATRITNHGFTIYWCPSCGRVMTSDHRGEMWDIPDMTRRKEGDNPAPRS